MSSCKTKEEFTVTDNGEDLPYRKVAKSTDVDLKFAYAEKYYKNQDYYKALTLYEEIIPLKRLTEEGRLSYFRYAQCHYEMGDWYLAGYYFKQFHKNNGSDQRAEDALFLSALCKVKLSPDFSLDQTDTEAAVNRLQLFLDRYPQTQYKDTCNQMIDRLSDKLDLKKYEWAYLYYKTEDYKAATIAFNVCLEEYPQSDHKEKILYYRMKSYFKLAENSIESKKVARYEETIKSYHKFVSAFPESKYTKDAKSLFESTKVKLSRLQETN